MFKLSKKIQMPMAGSTRSPGLRLGIAHLKSSRRGFVPPIRIAFHGLVFAPFLEYM